MIRLTGRWLAAALLAVGLAAGIPAAAPADEDRIAGLEDEREFLTWMLSLEGVYFINGQRFVASGHVLREFFWIPLTTSRLTELHFFADQLAPIQDWSQHLRLLREDDRVLRVAVRQRLDSIEAELAAIPGTEQARRSEASERDFLLWQLSLNDVVFIDMRRFEPFPGLAQGAWLPISVADMAAHMMLASLQDPGFDWAAEFRALRDAHLAYVQALRDRLAEIDAEAVRPVPVVPPAAPPAGTAAFPPLHAAAPTHCGAQLSGGTRTEMRDTLYTDYEDGIWKAHRDWNGVSTFSIYGSLRDHIMRADHFAWHWEVNVPVWWARVRCASGCILATPRPYTHEAGAAHRACLRNCEDSIRYFSCDSSGAITSAGTVIRR